MVVTRQRKKVLGRAEDNAVSLGKGRIIPSDSKRIASINRELRIKCEEQRIRDAEAAILSRDLIAGSGPVLVKKK